MRERAAACTLRSVQGGAAREYLAECLWPGVSDALVAAASARARASAAASRGSPGEVSYLGFTLMPADEVVFFAFRASSLEAVQAVAERAEIPFARIVEALRAESPSEGEER
jgi:hypothetical protein